ncbi:MAG: NifU family protein [Actinomycetota bacterium]|nr:NifU family protein [Actinomycetota bacterium]
MSDNDLKSAPVLTLTDGALTKVLQLRSDESDPESLALWVEVSGTSGNAYTYDMYFQAASDARPDAWTGTQGGLMLVVAAESAMKMVGSILDVNRDLLTGGMSIRNPNTPPPSTPASPAMTGPPPDLSGDVAQRVLQVLDAQINPSIAAHGGRADLVAVDDGAAYLRLSGGCAGCGMAAVTLSQGIEVAIKESVPEVVRIVDVTDHAAGTNPYYEAAKK